MFVQGNEISAISSQKTSYFVYGIFPIINLSFCAISIMFSWDLDASLQRLFFLNILLLLILPFIFEGWTILFILGSAVFLILNILTGLTVPIDELDRLAFTSILFAINFLTIVITAFIFKNNGFTWGLILSLIPSFIIGFYTTGLAN